MNSPRDWSPGILAKWTGGFSSFHKCSTDFRSGLIEFLTSPTLVFLAACFGSLSCRRTKIQPSANGPHISLHSSDKPGRWWQPGQIQDSRAPTPQTLRASFLCKLHFSSSHRAEVMCKKLAFRCSSRHYWGLSLCM